MVDHTRKKRPRDLNQLGKFVVDVSVGDIDDVEPTPPLHGKDPAAVSLGRRGGVKGGKARAERLSSGRRKRIAQQGAAARWKKDDS
jgi:hypothetical protein